MKKLLLLASVSMFVLGIHEATAATTQGTAKAEIVAAGAITAEDDLNFGRILNTETQKVTVSVEGQRTSTKDLLVGSTASAGSFVVKSTKGSPVTINVPGSIKLTKTGAQDLTVSNIMWKMGDITGTGGTQKTAAVTGGDAVEGDNAYVANTLYVGGDLEVPAGQSGGGYTGTYTVEVIYSEQ
jgi:hypothetical protein